jgi:F-type H+-transporting ATPase subunit a
MAAGSNPLSHVIQHPLKTTEADLGPLTPNGEITLMSDHISMLILAGLLLGLFLPPLFRRRKAKEELDSLVPSGFGHGIEAVCQFLRKEVAEPALGEYTDRFIKYIWSVFFFILTINLLGLLPLPSLTALPPFNTHIGGTATSNIWVTGTLALTTLFMMVFNGIRLAGKDFLAHLCPGPLWLAPILVPVEVMGMLAKTFALAVRLFANMVAGHTLLAVLLGFVLAAGSQGMATGFGVAVPVVLGSVAISLLEIFVAFLQAFIFTFLTTLFIGMSIITHHDEHPEEAPEEAPELLSAPPGPSGS